MIELAQHIEVLLLENDCVIVPGLGGFVTHYAPATRVAEENLFLPPTRIIGFNPQLKMNDGLIVQSYMSVYGTNFSDATKMVERKVDMLIAALHEEGKVDLPNIGEVRYTIYSTFDFAPYTHKLTTPYLYGMDAFQMQELSVLEKQQAERDASYSVPVAIKKEKRNSGIRFNRTYLTSAAAMVAVIILSFFFSTPIENTEVKKDNYAQLLPDDLLEKIKNQSLVITPIVVKRNTLAPQPEKAETQKQAVTAAAAKTTEPSQPAAETDTLKRPYHIIIASVETEQEAKAMATRLVAKGFSGAKAIIGDGKMRVCIESCDTEAEAYRAMATIRRDETYKNAWVLKKNF